MKTLLWRRVYWHILGFQASLGHSEPTTSPPNTHKREKAYSGVELLAPASQFSYKRVTILSLAYYAHSFGGGGTLGIESHALNIPGKCRISCHPILTCF